MKEPSDQAKQAVSRIAETVKEWFEVLEQEPAMELAMKWAAIIDEEFHFQELHEHALPVCPHCRDPRIRIEAKGAVLPAGTDVVCVFCGNPRCHALLAIWPQSPAVKLATDIPKSLRTKH